MQLLTGGAARGPKTSAANPPALAEVSSVPSASPPEGPTASPPGQATSTYAIPLPKLDGLPAAVPPGTTIQIWVAWNKPITKGPRIQRLVSGVTVAKVLPPTSPGQPDVVLLNVPHDEVPDLLYGHRWGALSATLEGP